MGKLCEVSVTVLIRCGIQAMIDLHYWAQSVPRKHSTYCYTTSTSLDCWRSASWVHGLMLLVPSSDLTMCASTSQHLFSYTFDGPVLTAASAFCYRMTKVEPCVMVFCCCSPSAFKSNMCTLWCYTAHHSYSEWLSEFLKPVCHCEPSWLVDVELSYQHDVSVFRTATDQRFFFPTFLGKI